MNWNTKYVVLVIILVSSLISIALNGLVTIIILVAGGFIFWILQLTKKRQSGHVTNSESTSH